MNSSSPRAKFAKKCQLPVALTWSHSGVAYRVTPWPEVRFERLYGEEWIETTPTEDVFASASIVCGPLEWKPYLEFVPAFSVTRRYALTNDGGQGAHRA